MAVKPGWEGRFFEDFEIGDIYRCRLGRTVTEADNIWFTLLTNNTNQIHFNNEYGKRTEFGKCSDQQRVDLGYRRRHGCGRRERERLCPGLGRHYAA